MGLPHIDSIGWRVEKAEVGIQIVGKLRGVSYLKVLVAGKKGA